ncbi:unnamed protein product [Peniophora sp. CBMAI 1063]|nr:unnamed protein product [Peniophora sp. CBMAI 1063]
MSGLDPSGQHIAFKIQGPILLGIALTLVLYGVNCCQAHRYFQEHASRGTAGVILGLMVASLLLLATLSLVFNGYYIYSALILHFGDADYLLKSNWSLDIELFFAGIVGLLTQGFFGHRVRKVTGNMLAGYIVWTLSVIQFIATVVTGALAFRNPYFLEFLHDIRTKIFVIIWLVASVMCDAIITSTLVLYLRRQKIGFADSDRVIDCIVRLTLQTGLTSTVVVSLDLVLYLFYRKQALHLIVNLMIVNVYINSTLCSLNARHALQVEAPGEGAAVELRSGCEKRFSRVQQLRVDSPTLPQVFVSSESHATTDTAAPSTVPLPHMACVASTSSTKKGVTRLSRSRSSSTYENPYDAMFDSTELRRTAAQHNVHRLGLPAATPTPEEHNELECSRPVSYADSVVSSDTISWNDVERWPV